ncbi:MAG: hypothetical protein BIFFINMI_01531 [Phycisphaerae bacterium]|nr:hypothetical protein [Phycisphaerae bacterium]
MESIFCIVDWSGAAVAPSLVREVLEDLRPFDLCEARVVLDAPGLCVAGGFRPGRGAGEADAGDAVISGRSFDVVVQGRIVGPLPENLADDPAAFARLADQPPDGLYNLLAWDRAARRLHVVSDLYSAKPLYYWRGGSLLVLTSEFKTLRRVPGFRATLDAPSLVSTILKGAGRGLDTIFQDVRLLPSGHSAVFSGDGLRLSLQTPPAYPDDPTVPPERELIERCGRVLLEASSRWLNGHERAIAALSGGIDSRLALGLCRRLGRDTVAATWGSPHSDEFRCARGAARALGVRHLHCPVRGTGPVTPEQFEAFPWRTEFLGDPAGIFTTRAWMDFIRQQDRTVIDGFLGDTLTYAAPPHFGSTVDARQPAYAPRSRALEEPILIGAKSADLLRVFRPRMHDFFAAAPPRDAWGLYRPEPKRLRFYPAKPGGSLGAFRRWLSTHLHLWNYAAPTLCTFYTRDYCLFFSSLPRRYLVYRRLIRKTLRHMFPALSQVREATAGRLPTPMGPGGIFVRERLRRLKQHEIIWRLFRPLRLMRWDSDYLGLMGQYRPIIVENLRAAAPILDEYVDVALAIQRIEAGAGLDVKLTIRLFNVAAFLRRFCNL